jgi:hypothetical protein
MKLQMWPKLAPRLALLALLSPLLSAGCGGKELAVQQEFLVPPASLLEPVARPIPPEEAVTNQDIFAEWTPNITAGFEAWEAKWQALWDWYRQACQIKKCRVGE